MNLKDLTWENHKKAERKEFASTLMSGNIDPGLYYKYLTNQFHMYATLEQGLNELGLSSDHWGVFRAELMLEDLQELEAEHGLSFYEGILCDVTGQYTSYIEELVSAGNLEPLIAHMYVRHFGDMYGGAMIQKRVPGKGVAYEFNNKEELKANLRGLLNDGMAVEANVCFEYAIKLFEELT
jgi:heme oxygenase